MRGIRTVANSILIAASFLLLAPAARAADEPDLIFRRSTVFNLLSPNDKLGTYGLDDPVVEGVACHFTVPENGGWSGSRVTAESYRSPGSQLGSTHGTNAASPRTGLAAFVPCVLPS